MKPGWNDDHWKRCSSYSDCYEKERRISRFTDCNKCRSIKVDSCKITFDFDDRPVSELFENF